MNIKEIQKIESNIQEPLMVRSISDKTDKNNKPYIVVDVTDGEEVLSVRIFGCSSKDCGFVTGDVIDISISSGKYNGAMTYTGHVLKVLDKKDYNISDYIVSAPISGEEMYADLMKTIHTFSNEDLKKLLEDIYSANKDKLLVWSAAKSVHHNFRSGLLYHTYRMVKVAEKITEVYNTCDKEMVIAGCLLHDIGKIYELSTDEFANTDYTVDGNLFGHLFIGAEIVKNRGKELKINNEVIRCLIHIIVSHHENKEWGAIAKPATIEAFLVSQIDHMDSKYIIFETECSKLEHGEMSDLNYQTGSCIYNPKC